VVPGIEKGGESGKGRHRFPLLPSIPFSACGCYSASREEPQRRWFRNWGEEEVAGAVVDADLLNVLPEECFFLAPS